MFIVRIVSSSSFNIDYGRLDDDQHHTSSSEDEEKEDNGNSLKKVRLA